MPKKPIKCVSETDQIKYWCWERNKNLDPSKLGSGSKKNAYWVCPNHDEPYLLRINHKSNGIGCSYCSGRTPLPGFNTLKDTHPDLADILVDPSDALEVTAGSTKLVDVRCLDHVFQIQVKELVRGKRCRFCSGNDILAGYNDFFTLEPELSKQLVDPSLGHTHTRNSSKMVEWFCGKGHVWKSSFKKRSGRGDGCPHCSSNVSGPERKISSLLEGKYATKTQYRIPNETFIPDFYIPELNLIIEYDGSWYHRDSYEKDKNNSEKLLEMGYKVLRFREQDYKNTLGSLEISHQDYKECFVRYLPKSEHITEELLDKLLR